MNKKEKEHLSKVASLGCFVCKNPETQIHHIRPKGTGIGRRSSHFETIPLCQKHHTGAFSIHNKKILFEKKYGTEREMLKQTREKLNEQGL